MATEKELLTYLRDWARKSGRSDIKDVHLQTALKSGKRTAQELSTGTPKSVSDNAPALAAALAAAVLEIDGSSQPAPAPEAPAVSEPPPAPTVAAPHSSGEETTVFSAPDPAPAAMAAPAPTATATAVADPGEQFDWDAFEEWDYVTSDGPAADVQITVRRDGAQVVKWTPKDAPAVYRLVSNDKDRPFSPDFARRVGIGRVDSAEDEAPMTNAVRYFQVWRNDGATTASAVREQPVLHAEGALVAPVTVTALEEDSGRVVAHWQTLPGVESVHVYRVPFEEAGSGIAHSRFRILADKPNLNGIIDDQVRRGARYVYQVQAQARAEVRGAEQVVLSPVRVKQVDVAAKHEAVRDLQHTFEHGGNGLAVDLTWSTPSGGTVVIYRTREAPEPGLDREPIPTSVLESQAQLRATDRLNQPIEPDGEQSAMRGVPWPEGWARAFFTPVVLLGDMAFVGRSARGSFVEAPKHVRIVERVSRQLLTFDWPDGADVMQVYRAPKDLDPELALHSEPFEISKEDYRELGGFEPGKDPLPRGGCALHLVSVLFDGGERVTSERVSVEYPGIARLHYTCSVKRGLGGRPSGAVVSIESREERRTGAPPFVLVYNADRLPLSAGDGQQLAMVRDSDEPGQPSVHIRPKALAPANDDSESWKTDPAAWKRVVTAQGGFVRMFVDLPLHQMRHVALLDPPLSDLRLRGSLTAGIFGGR